MDMWDRRFRLSGAFFTSPLKLMLIRTAQLMFIVAAQMAACEYDPPSHRSPHNELT
jgi:hypothetical protein